MKYLQFRRRIIRIFIRFLLPCNPPLKLCNLKFKNKIETTHLISIKSPALSHHQQIPTSPFAKITLLRRHQYMKPILEYFFTRKGTSYRQIKSEKKETLRKRINKANSTIAQIHSLDSHLVFLLLNIK